MRKRIKFIPPLPKCDLALSFKTIRLSQSDNDVLNYSMEIKIENETHELETQFIWKIANNKITDDENDIFKTR